MKTGKIFMLLFFVLATTAAGASPLFVTARVCPLFEKPSASSGRLTVLSQGEELVQREEAGSWIKVAIPSKKMEGFVQKLFVGDRPSSGKVSRADSMQNVAAVTERRRASAYTTSAAAARGLSSENVRARENLAFADYDFTSIDWLESLSWGEEETMEFARSEGIGYLNL